MHSGFEPIQKPEIFLALVSRLGTDTTKLAKLVSKSVARFGYKVVVIKASRSITDEFCAEVDDSDPEHRIEHLIDFCNSARACGTRKDLLALSAVRAIQSARALESESNDRTTPQRKILYLIDQFKRPEEIEHFRQIYGRQAIVFSLHANRHIRIRRLAERIADARPQNPDVSSYTSIAEKLLRRDDEEEEKPFGQNVRNAFPLADFVIDVALNEGQQYQAVDRFFEYFFGSPKSMPTVDEIGINAAFSASLSSTDLSRQVGAAVVDNSGVVQVTGWNDAPKPGGGTYLESDEEKFRDLDLGHDANERHKSKVFSNLISNLVSDGLIKSSEIEFEISDAFKHFKESNALRTRKSSLFDILEFSRSVHAEMNLISTAARLGISLKNATLYCTTYPCHNCAKHIVAAGISRVVFLEPYPKSLVSDLHSDAIDYVDDSNPLNEVSQPRVRFEQFRGVAPNRFPHLFKRGKRKDKLGNVSEWTPDLASPVRPIFVEGYIAREQFTLQTLDGILSTFKELPASATTTLRKFAPDFFNAKS